MKLLEFDAVVAPGKFDCLKQYVHFTSIQFLWTKSGSNHIFQVICVDNSISILIQALAGGAGRGGWVGGRGGGDAGGGEVGASAEAIGIH